MRRHASEGQVEMSKRACRKQHLGATGGGGGDDDWGFWVDEDHPDDETTDFSLPLVRRLSCPSLSDLPPYVLEEALPNQALWHLTAGRRPRQPPSERAHFERLWESNFAQSEVRYREPAAAAAPRCAARRVLLKGPSPCLGASVSKSFLCPGCGGTAQLRLHVDGFRVVQGGGGGGDGGARCRRPHAEYLILVEVGEFTFGAWKRFTDFARLAAAIARPELRGHFRRSLVSWGAVLARQRWARCLEHEYLSVKCLLLQRFLHDLVFDSTAPSPLR
ncbi:hypothetical protein JKP88DRAFT_322489, partial [Tribonema minus]